MIFQRSPTRSTLSPAPPHTAQPSLTTWTSLTLLAPTSSMSWHSTPLIPKTRRICARWPLHHLRARSVMGSLVKMVKNPKVKRRRNTAVVASRPSPLSSSVCCCSPQALYQSWVLEASRNILAILEDMPSLKPPIDHLCELLPRLQARYYSIASSSKVIPYFSSLKPLNTFTVTLELYGVYLEELSV